MGAFTVKCPFSVSFETISCAYRAGDVCEDLSDRPSRPDSWCNDRISTSFRNKSHYYKRTLGVKDDIATVLCNIKDPTSAISLSEIAERIPHRLSVSVKGAISQMVHYEYVKKTAEGKYYITNLGLVTCTVNSVSGGLWIHCSPQLLNTGLSCAETPRRSCECPGSGGHDHYIDFSKGPVYGFTDSQELIHPPSGWSIIPEGQKVPQVYREYLQIPPYMAPGYSCWADARRCHLTMTPLYACVWGSVRAFAKPVESNHE